MLRMISGICALGLMAGAYFVCPQALKQKAHAVMTPSDETLVHLQQGFDTLAEHLRGPSDVRPSAPLVTVASAATE